MCTVPVTTIRPLTGFHQVSHPKNIINYVITDIVDPNAGVFPSNFANLEHTNQRLPENSSNACQIPILRWEMLNSSANLYWVSRPYLSEQVCEPFKFSSHSLAASDVSALFALTSTQPSFKRIFNRPSIPCNRQSWQYAETAVHSAVSS